MSDTELREYQVLANKAFALYMLNPNARNRKIAQDAGMTYKAAILVNEEMSKGDNSAEYIDSLFEEAYDDK